MRTDHEVKKSNLVSHLTYRARRLLYPRTEIVLRLHCHREARKWKQHVLLLDFKCNKMHYRIQNRYFWLQTEIFRSSSLFRVALNEPEWDTSIVRYATADWMDHSWISEFIEDRWSEVRGAVGRGFRSSRRDHKELKTGQWTLDLKENRCFEETNVAKFELE